MVDEFTSFTECSLSHLKYLQQCAQVCHFTPKVAFSVQFVHSVFCTSVLSAKSSVELAPNTYTCFDCPLNLDVIFKKNSMDEFAPFCTPMLTKNIAKCREEKTSKLCT